MDDSSEFCAPAYDMETAWYYSWLLACDMQLLQLLDCSEL